MTMIIGHDSCGGSHLHRREDLLGPGDFEQLELLLVQDLIPIYFVEV